MLLWSCKNFTAVCITLPPAVSDIVDCCENLIEHCSGTYRCVKLVLIHGSAFWNKTNVLYRLSILRPFTQCLELRKIRFLRFSCRNCVAESLSGICVVNCKKFTIFMPAVAAYTVITLPLNRKRPINHYVLNNFNIWIRWRITIKIDCDKIKPRYIRERNYRRKRHRKNERLPDD